MTDINKIHDAMKVLKEECNMHKECRDCIFCTTQNKSCMLLEKEPDKWEEDEVVTPQKAYELGKLDALNKVKEEIKNSIVHSPYFNTTKACCGVRDDVMQIFDKHIRKIEEEE